MNDVCDDWNGEDVGGQLADMDFHAEQSYYTEQNNLAAKQHIKVAHLKDILAVENYFSPEAELKYMGSTQFKRFTECEARAMAVLREEWQEEKTAALLVGSYVDAYFEGTLEKFKLENPEIFTQKGALKSDYQHAEYIIKRIERDEMFMRYMSGQKQVIKTGEIAGVPFKIKIDSYHPKKVIVDLKIIKDFKNSWSVELSRHINFVEEYGYDIQGSIYQSIEGNKLPFMLAAATKEKPEPSMDIINIGQDRLDECIELVSERAPYYNDLKHGIGEPVRCEKCAYCKATKKLSSIIDYRDL